MFERVKRWLRGSAVELPPGEGEDPAAVERCAQAYHLGVEQFKAGEFARAEQHLKEAIGHKHGLAEAHFYLGLIYRTQTLLDDAGDELLLATAFKPDFAEAWFYLGVIALDHHDYDDAINNFSAALRIRPDYAEVYNSLGMLCMQRKQFREAAAHFRRATELKPRFALAYSNLAHVMLREYFDPDAAYGYVRKALELDPQLVGAHVNLAVILQFQGRCEEALAASARALELSPDAAETLMVRAYAQLMLGRFEQGWRDFEARKSTLPTFKVRKFPYPEWDGSPPAGRRMLVYHEQGLGDEIMFASCFPDLLALGAQGVIECSYKLERLFRRSFPAATILVADQARPDMAYLRALPPFDWQVAAGSLPRYFRRSWGDFPQHNGYLTAAPERIEYWRARLRALGPGRKIGLSWRGGRYHTNQTRRSLDPGQLRPLLQVPDTVFVSLQYDACRDELARLREQHGIEVIHWQEAIDDYDETAALVAALDLVVSVQTAVIHLAGALGKAVWVMVPSTPEWRYMARGERIPWYPSARIFRQAADTDWRPVVSAVRDELAAWHGETLINAGNARMDRA